MTQKHQQGYHRRKGNATPERNASVSATNHPGLAKYRKRILHLGSMVEGLKLKG